MQTDRQTDPPLPVLDDPFTFPFTVHRRTFVIPFGSPGVRLPFTWCTTEKEPFFSPTIGLEPLLERGSLLPVPLSGVWNVHSAWNPRGELLFRENLAAPHHSFLPFVEVTVPSTASPRPSPSPYLFCFDQRKGEKFSPRDFMTYYYIVLPEDWSTDMFPRRGITIPPPPPLPLSPQIGKGNGHLLASFCVISMHSPPWRLSFLRESASWQEQKLVFH